MRPVTVVVDSAGTFPYSRWVVFSSYSWQMGIAWNVSFEFGATGTVNIQTSSSNPEAFRKASFTRSGTTLTLICVDGDQHGLSTGDGINIRGTPWDNSAGYSLGVTVTSLTQLTVTVANSGATSGSLEYAPIQLDVPQAAYSETLSASGSGGTLTPVQMARITGEDLGSGGLFGKASAVFLSNGF